MSLIPIETGTIGIILSHIASNPSLLIMSTLTAVGSATTFIAWGSGMSGLSSAIMLAAGGGIAILSVLELTRNILPTFSEVLRDEIRIGTLQQVNQLANSIEILSYVFVAGMSTVLVVYWLRN